MTEQEKIFREAVSRFREAVRQLAGEPIQDVLDDPLSAEFVLDDVLDTEEIG